VRDAAGKETGRDFLITRAAAPLPSTAPPVLSVSSPSESRQTVAFETDKVVVKGTVSGGEGSVKVTVNGKDVKPEPGGAFSTILPLNTGENKVSVKAADAAKREDGREFVITREVKVYPPPVLSVSSPLESRQTVAFETDKVVVKGTVSGGEGSVKVTVNGKDVKPEPGGAFSTVLSLNTGENTLTLKAEDASGKEDSREYKVTRLAKVYPPPALNMTSPLVPRQTIAFEMDTAHIKGSVSGGEGEVKVTVNDREVKTDSAGSFSTTVVLSTGDNKVSIKARDSSGKEDAQEFLITRQKKVYPPPVLSVVSPLESLHSVAFDVDKVSVEGSVSGGEGTLRVTVNQREVVTDGSGSFSATLPLNMGDNRITVMVRDSVGREDAKEFLISRRAEEVAPPPALAVNMPTETGVGGKVSLEGKVNGGTGELRLMVDGRKVPVEKGGSFTTSLDLKTGRNRIVLRVEDSKGRQDSQVWLLFHYPTAER
jgi:uncharacterized protein YfaP (DUF2135 family)